MAYLLLKGINASADYLYWMKLQLTTKLHFDLVKKSKSMLDASIMLLPKEWQV